VKNGPDHANIRYLQKEGHAQVFIQEKCETERKMATEKVKRFGVIALEKQFIALEQLVEAMPLQIREETEGRKYRPIGQILFSLGYSTSPQIDEVMETMDSQ
jgi:hypothetical protein